MEFLRYPQVIPALFSGRLVRSSMKLYLHFNLPMDRSPGFGSTSCNYIALFRLALASAPILKILTSLHNVTRRSVLQKVRSRTSIVLLLLVNTGFQVLFHSPPGVLFTLPSRYCSSIGHQVVFRLGWWSTRLPTGFHVSRGTLDTGCQSSLSNTGLSPSMAGLPMPFF